MQKIIIVIMTLAFGLMVTQSAFARKRDNANYGFCPDGTKVADISKCAKKSPKKEASKKK